MKPISRRNFNKIVVASGLSFFVPIMKQAIAASQNNKRFLLVILRGGMDGLAAVPPYKDPNYLSARNGLGLPNNAVIPISDIFGLHTALEPLHKMYEQNELALIHAVASPYRKRSHFEAQDVLENGTNAPEETSSGWLNRAVEIIASHMGASAPALAVGGTVPIVLQGKAEVNSWSPDILPEPHAEFMERVAYMYEPDPLLHSLLEQAKEMDTIAMMDNGQKKGRNFVGLIEAAGNFMSKEDGPAIGVVELGGWDTHARQGLENGILSNKLREFAKGMQSYKEAMQGKWKDTVVLAVTEFGRTVQMNGTGGSDHGTAGAAFVAGGAINGGTVRGEWPGLANGKLYQGRDLFPANDLRSVMKSILNQHFNINQSKLDSYVFPNSEKVPYFRKLVG